QDQYYLEPDPTNPAHRLFARGPAFCLVETPAGHQFWVGTTHQKSRFEDSLEATQWRNRESTRTRKIMQQLSADGHRPVILLGDMNASQGMQGFEAKAGADAIAELIGPADSGLSLATAALGDSGAFSFGGYWRTAHRTLIDHVVVNDAMKP